METKRANGSIEVVADLTAEQVTAKTAEALQDASVTEVRVKRERRKWDPKRCMNGPGAMARRKRQLAKRMLKAGVVPQLEGE